MTLSRGAQVHYDLTVLMLGRFVAWTSFGITGVIVAWITVWLAYSLPWPKISF